MRIWDISPGYLNRQSLLGEHRELHGLVSVLVHNKKGYSRHPETLRWVGYGWALKQRHRQLACEMALRGYTDRSPVLTRSNPEQWPEIYIDPPVRQFALLAAKYMDKENGRIPLPTLPAQLWSQHKYSVLARDPNLYKSIGQTIAHKEMEFDELCLLLTEALREHPNEGGIRNAVQHMWGYVSDKNESGGSESSGWSLKRLLHQTQIRVIEQEREYLMHSTALSELMVWLPKRIS
ncbi:MAG: DUF1722 domain-containing protein [Mariprofundus sp.]|nr:DUF1722 domain-containing protein [Mariprofundus sp.]